ncbi:MAG TPA: DUF2341 domain-containing protein, partial [Candidatus Omnitrophota bacterium]|nr:DUF2341 domain-containing protein [Candidatus Omnitrophota bacterium]
MQGLKSVEKNGSEKRAKIAIFSAISLFFGLLFFLTFGNSASSQQKASESLIYQSPIVFSLPDITSETYEATSDIKLSSNIDTLTATWEFKGNVVLEVSANGGANYVPAVFGVPVDFRIKEFSSFAGKSLKWRAKLSDGSVLKKVKLVYTTASGIKSSFGSPELSGFNLRKPIYIGYPSSYSKKVTGDLFNYQIRVNVGEASGGDVNCGAKIKSDFNDIRFTAQDGETPLSFYLEEVRGTAPNRVATFYVKVPQIPKNGLTIYMYYGKAKADDLSSGEKTFDLFDNFQGKALDDKKWKNESGRIISREFKLKDGVLEYQALLAQDNKLGGIVRSGAEDETISVVSTDQAGESHSLYIGKEKAAGSKKSIPVNTFYNYRVTSNGRNIVFQRFDLEFAKTQDDVSSDKAVLKEGNIGLFCSEAPTNKNTFYKWVRVRQFAEYEPVVSGAGKEESVALPIFSGTSLNENGDIVLASIDGKYLSNGSYTIPLLATSHNVSAMVAKIKSSAGKISMSMSADGGNVWKENCEAGKIYYAPRDFTAGTDLLLMANIGASGTNSSPSIQGLKLEYSMAPVIDSLNIYCSGATGEGGVYNFGDSLVVEWDNSAKGDNNPDIISAKCNLQAFGGPAEISLTDDGLSGDKKKGDNIYSTILKLPQGMTLMGNAYVTVANSYGTASKASPSLSIDTNTAASGAAASEATKSLEEKADNLSLAKEWESDSDKLDKEKGKAGSMKKRYKIKFGEDEAEIGDFSSKEFKPNVKIKRWGEECYLNIEIPDEYISPKDQAVGKGADNAKVVWETSEIGARFYKKETQEIIEETTVKSKKSKDKKRQQKFLINENGGLEFELILKEKPVSHVISLPMESKGLKFFYQGELTAAEKEQGVVRPELVQGSYAVYHESKKDGEYQTGKAFHIYRPKIVDNNGNWVWGKLNIDEKRGLMTITIDKDWLDNAAYPVIIDPDFGYMTIGSSAVPISSVMRGSVFTAFAMTPLSITAYLENIDPGVTHKAKYAIY